MKNKQRNNMVKDTGVRKLFCRRAAPSTWFDDAHHKSLRAGQVVLEYALLVAVVAAAFIAMSFYIKRAVQGSITMIESKGVIAKAERLSKYHHDPGQGW